MLEIVGRKYDRRAEQTVSQEVFRLSVTPTRRFRLDLITSAKITGHFFTRDPDFELDAYAAQSFGSHRPYAEYQPTIWRFAPSAVATALELVFHPNQMVTEKPGDGRLVAFNSSRWVEMAWHLNEWGYSLEVIPTADLRDLVREYQRTNVGV